MFPWPHSPVIFDEDKLNPFDRLDVALWLAATLHHQSNTLPWAYHSMESFIYLQLRKCPLEVHITKSFVIYIGAIYLYHVRNRVSGQVIQTPYLVSKFQVSLIVNMWSALLLLSFFSFWQAVFTSKAKTRNGVEAEYFRSGCLNRNSSTNHFGIALRYCVSNISDSPVIRIYL